MFSSPDESLKDETRLLLLWESLLVTPCSSFEVMLVRIFTAKITASKSCLMIDLCFHPCVDFGNGMVWLWHLLVNLYIHVVKETENVFCQWWMIANQLLAKWCSQVHQIPWGHWQISNNWVKTFSVFITISLDITVILLL